MLAQAQSSMVGNSPASGTGSSFSQNAAVLGLVGPSGPGRASSKILLLVDDDNNSPLLVRIALKALSAEPELQYVSNGLEAIHYLEGRERFTDRQAHPFPDLMLLDLKMPVLDGFDLLAWVRARPEFKPLPIIVLTNSTYSPDVTRALQLGANSFLIKPIDPDEFAKALKETLETFLR